MFSQDDTFFACPNGRLKLRAFSDSEGQLIFYRRDDLEGPKLSYADTTVWQVLDGCFFAFPKEMAKRKEEFPELLGTFYENVKEEKGIEEYLVSERRLEYSMGIFRHYPELDRQ